MNILIVSATTFEIAPVLKHLEEHSQKATFTFFEYGEHTVYPLVTGVGALNTAFSIARFSKLQEIDVAINVGVAGAYNDTLVKGQVVEVTKDKFADLGVEEADGSFTDVYEMKLSDPNMFPYENGWISSKKDKYSTSFQKVQGLTVNKVHGTEQSISKVKAKYNADVETMEGAGFFYACTMADVHCLQLRSISNMVEPRNRANWAIDTAIDHLNKALIKTLGELK